MTTALSTKTHVLVLFDKSRYFLDEKEAGLVKQAIKDDFKYIEIGDDLIMVSSISRLSSGESYEEAQRLKRGDWVCSFGEWHERNEQCGHNDMVRYHKKYPTVK